MSPVKITTLSGKALGTFTLAALMSVLLIKFFSELALADENPAPRAMPTLDPPSVVLGTYRITDVVKSVGTKETSKCKDHSRNEPPDGTEEDRCNRLVWVVRTGNQIAILKANPEMEKNPRIEMSVIGDSGFLGCDSSVPLEAAIHGLFDTKICRATKGLGTFCKFRSNYCRPNIHNPEAFYFSNDNLGEKSANSQSTQSSLQNLMFGLPIGAGTEYQIFVPSNISIPNSIEVIEHHVANALILFTAEYSFRLSLTRVSE